MNTLPHGGRPDRPSLDETTSMQLIASLLEAGANPNTQLKLLPPFRNVIDDRTLDTVLTIGATPLLRAAKAFDAAAIKLLLAHGADVSIPNNRGVTPVMAAAGVLAVDADTRGIYTTEDTQQRSIESLKLLLAAGADLNGRERGRGLTALHEAARWGWNDVIQFLVANGADLTVKDNRGMTPVDSALGKAGGNSKFGQRIDVFENTAALLRELMSKSSGQGQSSK
jgi:ankyrin repeat protein